MLQDPQWMNIPLIENVFHFQSNLTHLSRSEYVPGVGLGIAKCPYDPYDNSTAIYIEKGNPGDLPALVSKTQWSLTFSTHSEDKTGVIDKFKMEFN